jgi:hypothetical protein
MKTLYKYIILIILSITLTSYNYQPNIIEPFQDYQTTQPYNYNNTPNKAPHAIDWNNLNYNDPIWGWYYKQLWYLYHPNSTETPPWLIIVPVIDIYPLFIFIITYLIYLIIKQKKSPYKT